MKQDIRKKRWKVEVKKSKWFLIHNRHVSIDKYLINK